MACPRLLPLAVFAMLLASALPAGAQQYIGVAGQVDIHGGQPGQTYHGSLSVQNQYSSPLTFKVTMNGTVGGWTVSDPPGPFTVPAKSAQKVLLAITPPDGTGPGRKAGGITFTTVESQGTLTASGATIRQSVTVILRVEMGGEARPDIVWLNASAEDAVVGEPLLAYVGARNDGNVRTVAKVHATATPLAGGDVAAQADGQVDIEPGQAGVARIDLGSKLPVGQYLVKVESTDPPGFNAALDAKVRAVGSSAADGRLLSILGNPRVPTGDPTTLVGWFQNTGKVPIGSARLFAQVLQGETVVAQLSSDAMAVPAHSSVNLTVIWTPGAAGLYTLVGHVEYEGYRTPDVEGRIEAIGQGTIPWPVIVGAAFILAALLAYLWVRRKK
ncbi:MAG TPA: hypothetical protein VM286_06140 [Candidatus Thermoplasmatota archaeon]|nr:hypothetical protein [Candidatus Thermoplasmatota archaeon]